MKAAPPIARAGHPRGPRIADPDNQMTWGHRASRMSMRGWQRPHGTTRPWNRGDGGTCRKRGLEHGERTCSSDVKLKRASSRLTCASGGFLDHGRMGWGG
eukprot:4942536-Pyramimonas_sp.AAC.1